MIKRLKSVFLKTKMEKNPESTEVIFYEDGAIAFTRSHGEHFIYLYRDEVSQLKEILGKD